MAMSMVNRALAWIDVLKNLAGDGVDIGDPATRDQVLLAVNAVDNWVDANQISFNAALPEPFATWATSKQKAIILALVLVRRFLVG